MYYTVGEAQKLNINTADSFIKQLKEAFGDPDEQGQAQEQLQRLRQSGKPIATYWAELRKLSAILSLDDTSTRVHFLTGLDPRIKNWLATQISQLQWSLQSLVNHITTYDNQKRQFQDLSRQRPNTKYYTPRNTVATPPQAPGPNTSARTPFP